MFSNFGEENNDEENRREEWSETVNRYLVAQAEKIAEKSGKSKEEVVEEMAERAKEYGEKRYAEEFGDFPLDDDQKKVVDEEAGPKFRIPTKTDIYSIEEFPKGTGGDGLIWIMKNRMLPVKFLLHVIAWKIHTSGGPFVRLDYIKDTVMVELESSFYTS